MKKVIRWTVLGLVVVVAAGFAFARSVGMLASARVYAKDGVAIGGYDPVAYFDEQRAIRGREEFNTEWNGATWHFSSSERLQRFRAEPERYAPQFGGYCAYAVSQGYTARTDPAAFEIVGGKLYLNFDADAQKAWTAQKTDLIVQGQANWPGVLLGR